MATKNKDIKRQRFEKIAARRVQYILDGMESLSKCSNKNNYDYNDKDVKKMLQAIKDKMKFLELSFSKTVEGESHSFKF